MKMFWREVAEKALPDRHSEHSEESVRSKGDKKKRIPRANTASE